MIESVLTLVPLLVLGVILLSGITVSDGPNEIFGFNDCKIMRGFWCIVIIMVHLPAEHGNPIQDAIGSFAYIGVSFFFMTSGYGLTVSREKVPQIEFIRTFWNKRIFKIILTCLVSNVIIYLIWNHYLKGVLIPSFLVSVNPWVLWLLACYFFFWISNVISGNSRIWKSICIVAVLMFSFVIKYLILHGNITDTEWTVEVYGFIWGILLASLKSKFTTFFYDKWRIKLSILLITSITLGLTYINYKTMVFYGDYLLKIALGLAITVLLLAANIRVSLGSRLGKFVGAISFEVYLMHMYMFSVIEAVAPSLSSGVYVAVSIFVSVCMAYIDHLIVSFILNGIDKMRFGGKNET
ncbi:MAG: acyltransferase [Lachnospiraceae bacterium]|nr:acyltransferase [Lachnospiraceae bacterium]